MLKHRIAIIVVGSVGIAGVGGGATFAALIVLSAMNLPVALAGLLISIEPLIDMGRTALNVAGQALVPTIVAHREGLLDRELYDAPRSGDPFVPEDAAPEATAATAAR